LARSSVTGGSFESTAKNAWVGRAWAGAPAADAVVRRQHTISRMGNHFVPQAYLRGFQDPSNPDFIWVQSRREPDPRSASIEDVAQSRNFYDPEIEKLLASSVEGPANPVLAKLRAGELPTDRERIALAVYLATMIKRVPKNRIRGRAMAPQILDEVVSRFRGQVQQLAS
jgi:hypothetical protein